MKDLNWFVLLSNLIMILISFKFLSWKKIGTEVFSLSHSIKEHFTYFLQPCAHRPRLYCTFYFHSFNFYVSLPPQNWTMTTILTSTKVFFSPEKSCVQYVSYELCVFVLCFHFSLKHLWTIKCCNCASHTTNGKACWFLCADGSCTKNDSWC